MVKKEKRTKAKAKNVIQKVIVNVGKGGGGRTRVPSIPRPTPLQQATQFVQAQLPLVQAMLPSVQSRPLIEQSRPLIESAQILSRLLEPINLRLETLIGTRQPVIEPKEALLEPKEALLEPKVALPELKVAVPEPTRQKIADLPDAPLIQPEPALVSNAPIRLDPIHEDVPLEKIEPKEAVVPKEAVPEPKELEMEVKKKKKPIIAPKKEESIQAQLPSAQQQATTQKQTILDALSVIKESRGVRGNEKPSANQLTKNQLITLVQNATGRTFSPSMSVDYERLRQKAITFMNETLSKL